MFAKEHQSRTKPIRIERLAELLNSITTEEGTQMNLYQMTREQVQSKLDELQRDGNYRNRQSVGHRKIAQDVAELERRLKQLNSTTKMFANPISSSFAK